MPHNPSGERVFTLGSAGLKRLPRGLTSWRRGMWVRVASPFLSLHFSTQFLSITAHKSLLTTCHCVQCCMCLLEGVCRHFVSREHALSSVPGDLSHRMPLMLKNLLSPLGSRANIKGRNGPRGFIVSCDLEITTRGRPRPPESGHKR